MIPTFFFPPKKYMKTKTHVAGHVASSGFLWLPPASSGEKASCRYLWNLWYRTDVGETCGTWFIRWISSGFFGGFLVEVVKKLFIFQGQVGELPLLVLVVMWFSRGLFSQQLPTHSDFWNYREFACFFPRKLLSLYHHGPSFITTHYCCVFHITFLFLCMWFFYLRIIHRRDWKTQKLDET